MSRTLQGHYIRVLRSWPVDQLRGVTFQDSLRRRMTQRFFVPSQKPQENLRVNAAQVSVPPELDGKSEMEQLNAMYSLLENRYSNASDLMGPSRLTNVPTKYPTSKDMMRPAFKPSYYEDLAAEMEAAPKRSWLQNQWLRWSKLVRLS